MKSADPYPVILAGIAGIQALRMAKAVGVESLSRTTMSLLIWLFMDSRLIRIFCANSPSQKARGASDNLLLLLRKNCLFCHRSECYGPPSPSISLESIKSLPEIA